MLHHTSNSAKFFFFLANCNTLYSSVNQVSVVDGFLAATEEFFLAYHVTVDLDGGPVLLVYRLDDSCLRFRLFLQQFLCVKFGNRDHWNTHVRRHTRVVRLDHVFKSELVRCFLKKRYNRA